VAKKRQSSETKFVNYLRAHSKNPRAKRERKLAGQRAAEANRRRWEAMNGPVISSKQRPRPGE
jgi:hypothetical protein